MSEWISVKECLPEMTEVYTGSPKRWRGLVYTGHYSREGSYEETYAKRVPRWLDATGRCINVTHWMPLPDPPQTDGAA